MSDLIDRQAAIDAVKCGALSAAMVYGRTDAGRTALSETVKAIKALPSAQPETEERTAEMAQNVPNNDLVSRKAAIDALHMHLMYRMGTDSNKKRLDEWINNLPSAQPDIVACGDCIHWICHDRRCGYWNHGVKPLDWCCHAERRTDE